MIDKSIFAKAADIIEERGWHQGWFSRGLGGPVCALGAMNLALGGAFASECVNGSEPYVEELDKAARRKARKKTVQSISAWNDNPHRTKQQVVDLLRSLSK